MKGREGGRKEGGENEGENEGKEAEGGRKEGGEGIVFSLWPQVSQICGQLW
jgi:hypothetical protein